MIRVTELAFTKAREIRANNGLDDQHFVRMGVRGGGCSGLIYTLAFDNALRPSDHVYSYENMIVAVDMKSYVFLDGTTLEYGYDVHGGGFYFNNPTAVRTCCCSSARSRAVTGSQRESLASPHCSEGASR